MKSTERTGISPIYTPRRSASSAEDAVGRFGTQIPN